MSKHYSSYSSTWLGPSNNSTWAEQTQTQTKHGSSLFTVNDMNSTGGVAAHEVACLLALAVCGTSDTPLAWLCHNVHGGTSELGGLSPKSPRGAAVGPGPAAFQSLALEQPPVPPAAANPMHHICAAKRRQHSIQNHRCKGVQTSQAATCCRTGAAAYTSHCYS
jgi:hypothetical protein